MSRYIDAELLEPDTEWDDYEDGFTSYSQLNIDTAETADVVEVVRCKDCRYWDHETDLTYCEKKLWLGTDATDYCSYGERRE